MSLITPNYSTIGLLRVTDSLSKVFHDTTLFGDGTQSRPLKVLSSGNVDWIARRLTSTETIVLKGYTVATLPTGVVGMTAYCTDLTTPTYRGAAVGGGAVIAPVFYNGSAWITA